MPSVPKGKKLDFGSEEFKEFEELGEGAQAHLLTDIQCTVCGQGPMPAFCKGRHGLCDTGVEASKEAAFVLVAGGLGERLGYKGIKVALPTELASEKCFLQVSLARTLHQTTPF